MMRCLREVNVDNNTVGWRVAAAVLFAPVRGVADALRRRFRRARYQSTYLGSYQTVELIETFLNYQARASRSAGEQPPCCVSLTRRALGEQDHIKRCVCIIYDPVRSTQGTIALKARARRCSGCAAAPTLGFRRAVSDAPGAACRRCG